MTFEEFKKRMKELERKRNIEQGAWTEVKKYQDELIGLKKDISDIFFPHKNCVTDNKRCDCYKDFIQQIKDLKEKIKKQ